MLFRSSDHQYHNALFLKEQKLGFVLRENELDSKKFFEILDTCNIQDLSTKLKESIKPDGAKKIVELIVNS